MTAETDKRPSAFSKKVQIINKLGLHARTAAIIAKKAQTATSAIWIIKENKTADAASIIDILSLECTKGTWITLTCEDPADQHVVIDILENIQSGFGE